MPKDPRVDVVKKALTDAKFKAELLKNANAAVEKTTGVKVPSGVAIKVLEDSASVVHLVLPAVAEKGALSDGELSGIAGGASSTNIPVCSGSTQGQYMNFCGILK